MSRRPPDDEDPLFQSLFDQVKDAFSDTEGIEDEELQKDLFLGIRDSLRALLGMSDVTEPHVTVVEGGRSSHAPKTDGEPPDLRVADPLDEENESSISSNVQVRVLKPEDLFQVGKFRKSNPMGKISLSGSSEAQLIYWGKTLRNYRIHCEKESLSIDVGTEQISSISAGQSIDVEGTHIQVRGSDCSEASGYYFFIEA